MSAGGSTGHGRITETMATAFDPFKEYMLKLKSDNAHLPKEDLMRLLRAAEADHVRWILDTSK